MAIKLEVENGKAFFKGQTYSYKDMIKAIPGAAWSKPAKRWEIPVDNIPDALRLFPTLEMSADVKKAYSELTKRRQKAINAKKIDEKKANGKVKGLKGTLYPYQAVGLEFLKTLEDGQGDILAFDMGLGKSLTSLAYGLHLKNEGIIDHIMVVCPAKLKYATWAKEVEKWTNMEYIVIDGDQRETVEWEDGTKERITGAKLREVQYQQYQYGADVMIMNYELFLRDMDIIPPVDGRWLVILDEAHRIKNPKAVTTKNLFKKLAPAGRKVLGTGTPLENNILELWTLTDFCRKGILGTFWSFQKRYMVEDYFGKPVAPKTELIPELMNKLEPIMLRKTKAEALPDLPPLTVINHPCGMTKEQSTLYKQVKDGIVAMAKEEQFTYLESLAQITRLQQCCDSPALLRELTENPKLSEASGKLEELENIIGEINPDRNKFILFSKYSQMTDIMYKWLQDKGILRKEQIGYVKGGIKAQKIEEIRKGFQEGDLQCVLMTTAGNYGLDLYEASYVICYDTLFNPQKMEQIYSRAHRNGAKKPVTAINLVTTDSYEIKMQEILDTKRELFKAVVDEDADVMKKLFGSPQDILAII
jgi:SNF2 family DNA or RNA helicase